MLTLKNVFPKVPVNESDTTALLKKLHGLSEEDGVDHVLKTMSLIRGPWVFVFYQVESLKHN